MRPVRAPAVAGSFYPAAPDQLDDLVEALLRRAGPASEGSAHPKALIVPHAGYVYSGETAAHAFAQLEHLRGRIRRVVLLGPAHRVYLRGLAAPNVHAFATPLGSIPIDTQALDALSDLPQVVRSDEAHAQEHSLEVQLPFLQHVLGAFELVPLVVGQASDAEVADVIERLWGGDETLIVVSSDLSHYHDYATAQVMDAESCRAIESLHPEALGEDGACGRIPVRGLLHAAKRHGLAVRTLDLRNSGDTAGDRQRVVGYGAWALAERTDEGRRGREDGGEARGDAADAPLQTTDLLGLARNAIATGLALGREPTLTRRALSPELAVHGACFVTLRNADGTLRGCIGSLEPVRSLAEDVVANAWAASNRDPRFEPVTEAELRTLSIELSILGPLEPLDADTLEDVVSALRPGRDGLVLEDGRSRGTLLPAVWDQMPDARTFVATVWRKAGRAPDHWSPAARAWRYGVTKLGPG